MPTIKEICDELYQLDPRTGKTPLRNPTPITKNMVIRAAPKKVGLVQITPEQALSIIVERVTVNGKIDGYQRVQDQWQARRIAAALSRGEDIAEVSLALDKGNVYADDGAHRLMASVIAKKPVWGVIRERSPEQRAARFTNQSKARRPGSDVLALSGGSAIHRYIQAAVVARKNGAEHPWAQLVGQKNTSAVMGPHLAVVALTNYALAIRGSNTSRMDDERINRGFKPVMGEELARLFLTFGTKSTNPLAFRPAAIRGIADASVTIIAKQGRKPADIERWARHMATFDWAGYAWVRSSRELAIVLVRHWNKRLGDDKRINEV